MSAQIRKTSIWTRFSENYVRWNHNIKMSAIRRLEILLMVSIIGGGEKLHVKSVF